MNRSKKTIFSSILILLIFTLGGCDKNKTTAENTAKEFATALNDKDMTVVYDLYPDAKELEKAILVDSIKYDKLEVAYNEKDSLYNVTYLPGDQSVDIKVAADGTAAIVNSHKVVQPSVIATKLAMATGVPIKRMKDKEVFALMKVGSGYISFLASSALTQLSKATSSKSNCYSVYGRKGGNYFCELRSTLTSPLDYKLMGEDYQVEFTAFDGKGNLIQKYVVDGVDIMPGETHVFTTEDGLLYNYAYRDNLKTSSEIVPKDRSYEGVLYIFGNFNGKEFNDFISKYPTVDINDSETFNVGIPEEGTEEFDMMPQMPDY